MVLRLVIRLTSKRVAWVCQHQLKFLQSFALLARYSPTHSLQHEVLGCSFIPL